MHCASVVRRHFFRNKISTKTFKRGLRIMATADQPKDILGFEVKDIDGNSVSLSKYKGFVSLIVNVASK